MGKKLLLVDLENKHKVDLSPLDSFKAIIFVGANQNPPKAFKKPATAHRFSRVDFLKISGSGKNALDFHIAHNEEDGFAAGENYFPEGMPAPDWYQPVNRGLEIQIADKLAALKSKNNQKK